MLMPLTFLLASGSAITTNRHLHATIALNFSAGARQAATSTSISLNCPDINDKEDDNTGRKPRILCLHHWFTQLLPEGWCVGVSTDASLGDSSLHSTIFLHPDEYQWGVDNIASESSRTSYYLGRMALRLSLDALLQSESMDMDAQEKRLFFNELKDEIRSTAINKDSYGRPILPAIISGSISHKGGNAVGLARFRHALDNNHFEMLDTSTVKWREECPIHEDDDNTYNDATDGIPCISNASTVRGIGVDLERIDARRGQRIERKVLTETEQAELGALEVRMPLEQ